MCVLSSVFSSMTMLQTLGYIELDRIFPLGFSYQNYVLIRMHKAVNQNLRRNKKKQ